MTYPELKPCPFCGGEVELHIWFDKFSDIMCKTEDCIMHEGCMHEGWSFLKIDRYKLADMWNRRAK
jgi:hypothetical protein